jgi:hypothetical protein
MRVADFFAASVDFGRAPTAEEVVEGRYRMAWELSDEESEVIVRATEGGIVDDVLEELRHDRSIEGSRRLVGLLVDKWAALLDRPLALRDLGKAGAGWDDRGWNDVHKAIMRRGRALGLLGR